MRKIKALQKTPYMAPEATPLPVPVPTGGWDGISPLSSMDPKNAVIMQNWVPRPGWVELRPGYTPWAECGLSHPVETLACYRTPTTQKLFAWCNKFIFDVSTVNVATKVQGTGTASDPVLSQNRWQYVNFSPQGSNVYYLFACNGTDAPRTFNGSVWTHQGDGNHDITGITPSSIINVAIYNRRLWFAIAQSTQFAFLGTDAISGPATVLDLGALWDLGGTAVAMCAWTVDGGVGPNNYAAFISSRGQATLYVGTDPTNANTWNLVGTFNLPPPLGYRCMTRVGSDIGLITLQGVIPISQALPYDQSAVRSVSITSQIQNPMAQAANFGQFLFGWQLITYPAQTLAFLNVPLVENSQQNQFVMNALTGAWCQFTGWNANCFELYNDALYFGDNIGTVNLAYNGGIDGINNIVADLKCAFNYMQQPETIKQITMVQPMMVADGLIKPTISVDVDFADASPAAPVTTFSTLGAVWDTAIWDTSTWDPGTATITNWLSAEGVGRALAIRMKVNFSPSQELGFDNGVFDTLVFDAVNEAATLQVNHFNAMVIMGGAI